MFTCCNFKLVSLWCHLILDPTLWSPIGHIWMWIILDCESLNFKKKTALGWNTKFKISPVRCQTNTLLKSGGKRAVNLFIIVALYSNWLVKLQETKQTLWLHRLNLQIQLCQWLLVCQTILQVCTVPQRRSASKTRQLQK